jgi:DNA polymerase (family 10)
MSVYLTDARRFGVSLLFATGSRKHLERLQQRAADRGMTLTPEGLRRGRKIIAAANEAEIYEALGLQFIEPELREGLDEIERAAARKIPPLVTAADVLGVLHAHTTPRTAPARSFPRRAGDWRSPGKAACPPTG